MEAANFADDYTNSAYVLWLMIGEERGRFNFFEEEARRSFNEVFCSVDMRDYKACPF